jgi:hypothetical protein
MLLNITFVNDVTDIISSYSMLNVLHGNVGTIQCGHTLCRKIQIIRIYCYEKTCLELCEVFRNSFLTQIACAGAASAGSKHSAYKQALLMCTRALEPVKGLSRISNKWSDVIMQ